MQLRGLPTVCQCSTHRSLKCVGSFGKRGSGRGELHYPYGIALDKDGFVLFVVYKCCRKSVVSVKRSMFSLVFESRLKSVTYLSVKAVHKKCRGELHYPHGIAIDKDGFVFVILTI